MKYSQLKYIFVILFIFVVPMLKGQVVNNNYKNIVSIDIGNFAMVNYYRQLILKNKYTLNGQFGIGAFFESKNEIPGIIGALNTNVYINNLYSIRKHTGIIGIGGQAYKANLKFIGKIGYQYKLNERISLNMTLYQCIWEKYSFANQVGDGNSVTKNWIWHTGDYDVIFSFGINFYF